ncbi:P2Y purinoceptor 14-like [Notolabrus celidotus]|uniref:P2Y purinoceptor 14-like n=1 Tax=Notolabrus celidotus TaxID=1203425 RepID=UPI00149039A6|nr:P2Y purinoceptor 14-like [Notolabrus celidotus]
MEGLRATPPFNQSSPFNDTNINTSWDQVHPSASLFIIVVYSLVFLVGSLLNGFTLKVYFCSSQRQPSSSVTIYLKNLAAADFLMSLCLPVRISHFASSSVTVFRVYCNFGATAFYLNMYASILFMGYIAGNRYLKIVHPLGTHILQTVRAAYIISTLTWVFLLAMTTTYVTLSLFTSESPPPVSNTMSCDSVHSEKLSVFYKAIHTCSAVIFILVLVSLVFFYYSTSRRLSVAQQRQPKSSSSKKLAKSRRNMLVLVSVFCVCFVPYHLVRLPYAFLKRRGSWGQAFFYLKEISILVSVLNVCLDPLIYFIFCKAFRAQLSFRREFSTDQDLSHGAKAEGRSSDGRTSVILFNRKTSLTNTKIYGVQ